MIERFKKDSHSILPFRPSHVLRTHCGTVLRCLLHTSHFLLHPLIVEYCHPILELPFKLHLRGWRAELEPPVMIANWLSVAASRASIHVLRDVSTEYIQHQLLFTVKRQPGHRSQTRHNHSRTIAEVKSPFCLCKQSHWRDFFFCCFASE